MRKNYWQIVLIILLATPFFTNANEFTKNFVRGNAPVSSISVMTFGPEGILFIGDSKSGTILAIDTEDNTKASENGKFELADIESKVASLLGTTAKNVIIHDMAANPMSGNVYLAVSKGNAQSIGSWKLPNDINYAQILLKIEPTGKISEFSFENVSHSKAKITHVIPEGVKNWRKSDKRTETITDLAYNDGKLFIAGLSNEEFASSLHVVPFPFKENTTFSTIEIWHAAHGKFETEAPIRTFLPFHINENDYLLAAYTCTPLVSIPVAELSDNAHVKTKTLAELGAGNIPLDMLEVEVNGKPKILIANTNRTLMSIDPDDIKKQTAGVTTHIKGYKTAGVPYISIPQVGILQIDNLNKDHIVALKRMPNGSMDIISFPTRRL